MTNRSLARVGGVVALVLAVALGVATPAPCQTPGGSAERRSPPAGGAAESDTAREVNRLRAGLDERWRVVPTRDGFLLVPRQPGAPYGGVELTENAVAIDGSDVSGAELRRRLGADADAVLALTYLSPEARRELLAGRAQPPELEPSSEPEPSPRFRRRWDRGGARVRIGQDVTVPEGERTDSVVAVFGSAMIDGDVDGDVVSVGGQVRLGPKAQVRGDVTAVGGTVERAGGALVGGEVHEVSFASPNLHVTMPDWRARSHRGWPTGPWRAGAAASFTIARVLLLMLLVGIVWLLGRQHVERVSTQVSRTPLAAFGVGLAAAILIVPAFIALTIGLIVSIVGIPLLLLLPVLVLLLGIAWIVGFAGVAHRIGSRVAGAGTGGLLAGLAIVWGLTLAARLAQLWAAWAGSGSFAFGWLSALGILIEGCVWITGLGALILTWLYGTMEPTTRAPVSSPPPVPAAHEV